jgi:tRNA 2-thiouridine synthesizing protein B
MPILHIVNRAPSVGGMPERLVGLLGAGDGLLLIENGVYGALRGVLRVERYPILAEVSRFVLVSDLEQRGLALERCDSSFQVTDYAGFVDLIARFDASISWG